MHGFDTIKNKAENMSQLSLLFTDTLNSLIEISPPIIMVEINDEQ